MANPDFKEDKYRGVNHLLNQIKSPQQSKDWFSDWGSHSFIKLPSCIFNGGDTKVI